MIEQFLQRKLANLVDQYIEFQKLMLITAQGMTIKNSKIKPKLAQLLSQVMQIPLQLVSGSISSLTLNKPWEKLFFFMNSHVKIAIQNVHIKTKLPNKVNEEYLLKKKEGLIERITEGLFNPLEAILHKNHSYVNRKLKQYFLSTIILEVKNICFEIEVDLKHTVTLIIKIDNLKFRKEDKGINDKQKIHLQILGAGVYYRAFSQKEIEFISPTKIQFERIKTENIVTNKRSSVKTLNIQRLQFNVNNINYGDIARIILLIQWHNSFQDLAYSLWKQRPFILNEFKPFKKFQYVAHLIKSSMKQGDLKRSLQQRRQYILLYDKLLSNANDFTPENKIDLNTLERQMPVWKIIAYRNFCINVYKNLILAKKKKNEQLLPSLQKKQGLVNTGWFKSWSATEKNKDQLEQEFLKKMNTIQFVPDDIESIFYVSVDKFKVKLSIVTEFGVQPFISLVGTDCSFRNTESLLEKTWEKHIQIIRCKIEYEKYLGHSERYRNFISECREHLDESQIFQSGKDDYDQFEEVGKFLEINFKNDSKVIEVNLLPFDIFINHDVIQRFSILLNIENLSKLSKVSRLQQKLINKTNPWSLVEIQKQKMIELKRSQQVEIMKLSDSFAKTDTIQNFSQAVQGNDEKREQIISPQKEIIIKITFNIIIPFDLRSSKSPELVIQIAQLCFNKKQSSKIIELRGILVKYKMPQKEESQEEDYKHIANFFAPKIQQNIIIRRFNVKIIVENHLNFDKTVIQADSINVQLPPQHYIFSLIELIFLHIPKSKQSRVKQFIRRKQSIGQQFIDACENLKEHFTKSMIMSSEKLSKKSILLEKKTKQIQISFRGMSITQKDFQMLIGQVKAIYNQVSYDNKSLSSNNFKNVKLTVHNVRKMMETLINLKLHITKQSIKRGFNSDKSKSSANTNYLNVTLADAHVQVIISLKNLKSKKTPSLKLAANDIYYGNNIERSQKQFQAAIALYYDQQIQHSERFNPIPFVEPCEISYSEKHEFTHSQKYLNIEKLSVNIKPSLFKFASRVLKDYYIEESTTCTVVNETINTIEIKRSHQNHYKQCKHNQKFTTENYYCQMNIFNMKISLEFNQHHDDIPKQKIQCINISQNNFLINTETSPNNYVLQSNLRLLNHQDKTLWLKVTENSSIITPDQDERLSLQRLSHTPKKRFDIDLTQRISDEQLTQTFFSRTSKRKFYSKNSASVEREKQVGKTFNIPLKPNQKVHLLIDSKGHNFLQILDQGTIFTELNIAQIFNQEEKLIKGEGQKEDQYLVIRSEISKKEGIEGFIYTIHIFSPIYIVNKTPWELEYRLSEEQVDFQEDDVRRIGRRRSFQLVPLKKIPILSSQKLRNIHYNQIQTMKLQLNKCERQIGSLLNLIASIKEKRNADHYCFLKQKKLITLRHNKKEIQLIMALQISANILKIKLYPQFIFINLTKQVMTFKIKQDQIIYPEIMLPGIPLDLKSSKDIKSKQKMIEHLSQYINLSDQKIKQRDALKQYFENFSNSLQVYTGKLQEQTSKKLIDNSKNKRRLIYNTTFAKSNSIELKLLGKSSKGYLSDYGSDGQFREQLTDFTEQPLQEQNLLIYSEQKYVFYKRVLKIEGYFNLILISPTVHIINKSQATFHAKSSCENLVTIHKNDHHFIHINQSRIDIQASFAEEEISLNQWMKLDLTRLGTIYYSKDMIQHHGSGYESKQYTLRKRRMKKTPKVFYRILLCKFERGQKILIEESLYPPITFLNNTKYRIKIEERKEHFVQQFINKGDMGEYAPKDPYYSPRFQLSVGLKYEYKMLLEFGVQKKQTYQLDKDIVVAVQEYKDKTIVQIKQREDNTRQINLAMSIAEGPQNNKQYADLLQQKKKFTLQISQMSINVLNNWNRELNSNFLQDVSLIYQNKNYKDYYKFVIKNIQGYDYMDLKPDFIYRRKKKEKLRLGLLHKQKNQQEMFLNFQFITNYHKNAIIIEKCYIKLDEIVFYLSADLILAYVKNYYEPINNLIKVQRYYENHQAKNKSDFLSKTYIFESLEWNRTFLKFQTRNLSIMETFLNKQYEKWLVKFINWLGDIKPIEIEPLKLTYEQSSLQKLKNHINLRNKMLEIGQQMMDYPISQLKDVVLFMIGEESKNLREKLTLFYNLVKSFEYIINFTLSLNENLKSELKTYNQVFAEVHKQNNKIIDKMIRFEYCEWKYKKDHVACQLDKKIKRLQRYNTRQSILQYDQFKAKVKLALDNHLENKLYKKVEHAFRINSDAIFAIAQQFAILYFLNENRWIVIPVQLMIQFCLNKGEIEITFLDEAPQHKVQQNKSHLKTMRFKNIELNDGKIEEVQRLLQQNKLLSYY